ISYGLVYIKFSLLEITGIAISNMGGCTMKKILISGGTGLVGNKIIENFSDAEFYILTRSDRDNTDNVTYINWSEDDYLKEVPEVDVVINLAGASISQ